MQGMFTIWAKSRDKEQRQRGTKRNKEEHRGTKRNTEEQRGTQNNTETAVCTRQKLAEK